MGGRLAEVVTSAVEEAPSRRGARMATLSRPTAVLADSATVGAPLSRRLTAAQQALADAARARVRAERGQWIRSPGDAEELVGGAGVGGTRPTRSGLRVVPAALRGEGERCGRCCGRGYLSCLACSD